eukprot:Selendium_serpulae@DN6153_c0_g1_i1.p1
MQMDPRMANLRPITPPDPTETSPTIQAQPTEPAAADDPVQKVQAQPFTVVNQPSPIQKKPSYIQPGPIQPGPVYQPNYGHQQPYQGYSPPPPPLPPHYGHPPPSPWLPNQVCVFELSADQLNNFNSITFSATDAKAIKINVHGNFVNLAPETITDNSPDVPIVWNFISAESITISNSADPTIWLSGKVRYSHRWPPMSTSSLKWTEQLRWGIQTR